MKKVLWTLNSVPSEAQLAELGEAEIVRLEERHGEICENLKELESVSPISLAEKLHFISMNYDLVVLSPDFPPIFLFVFGRISSSLEEKFLVPRFLEEVVEVLREEDNKMTAVARRHLYFDRV